MKQVNREDVAREAGVSVATVSYVINDGPRPVAPATRERVLAAIEKVGYKPNILARALAGGQSNTYGFVAPNITNPFIGEIAHALQAHAQERGKLVLFGDSADNEQREHELLSAMLARQVDGIIYMGVTEKLAVDLLKESTTPVVVVTHSDSDGHFPSVRINEVKACAILTQHMLDHGYTSLGLLTGPTTMMNSRLRLDGMRMPLANVGIAPVAIGWKAYSRAAGYRWATELVADGKLPRAIVTGNERQAAGVVAALSDKGIDVPGQVAVAALNGSSASAYSTPSLTCIRQPMDSIASEVFRLFADYESTQMRGYECGFDLAIGQSCGCRRPLSRESLATWNTPEPDSLDSAAGVAKLLQEDNHA
ncbi:LacI family DNA-binding transcriptional regulator [Trueperella pyogenes]|uniref:LacI family DNA-binding transcriptional regulator n=1 Tax=Trueperella pyogenes TaxID=1661 RepID=UPI00345C70B8